MPRQIEFCFDFISPYSYIALHALPHILGDIDAELVYKPMFLGAVMQQTGNRPPGMVPAKAAYMQQDIQRSCAHYGIDFRMHPLFPMMNTRPVLRAACALADSRDEQASFIRTIFHHVWAAPEPLKTDDLAQVEAVCNAAGLDGGRIVALSEEASAKNAMIANTDSAIARGAFGAPSFFVGDALFFGHDRLDYAAKALKADQLAR